MLNFANFLYQYGSETRQLIRKIENTEKKIINAELALIFNETCYNENILPRYTNISYQKAFGKKARPPPHKTGSQSMEIIVLIAPQDPKLN